MKRPAFQFYPADWRKDMALQSCSVAARGLWVDMLCIAHECDPYGHLTVNGKPMTAAQIGRHTGLTERECAKLLAELADAGVSSMNAEGVIFSRRMVRDEDIRNRRGNGGHAGAEHGAKGAEHGSKGGRPKKIRGVSEPPLEPPPSSSSSPSGKPSEAIASGSELPAADAPGAEVAAEQQTSPPAPQPPTLRETVFALGVPLLTAASVSEKNARSFLAMQAKTHGDSAVVSVLQRCAIDGAVEPISWIQRQLKPKAPTRHAGFETKDYREGITADGHLT